MSGDQNKPEEKAAEKSRNNGASCFLHLPIQHYKIDHSILIAFKNNFLPRNNKLRLRPIHRRSRHKTFQFERIILNGQAHWINLEPFNFVESASLFDQSGACKFAVRMPEKSNALVVLPPPRLLVRFVREKLVENRWDPNELIPRAGVPLFLENSRGRIVREPVQWDSALSSRERRSPRVNALQWQMNDSEKETDRQIDRWKADRADDVDEETARWAG